jgi:CBS domain containing-hemolysin-like protein
MDGSLLGLVAVAFLVLANGFFVATEFAIVAVRKSRLQQLAAEGHASARSAQEVVGHLDVYIAACQLGITMASLALGWLGEPAFAHLVEPPLVVIVGSFAPTAAHAVAVGVSFAIITALHIVIGELAPKGLALQRPEATTLAVARPMQLFERVFHLPIRVLNGVGNGVLRLFGLRPASGHEMVHSVDELRLLVVGMQQAGVVDDVEARIAGRAFQLGEMTVGELMTPRTEVEGVPVTAALEQALEAALASGHTRLVVYDRSLDDVIGVVHLRDLVRAERSGGSDLRSLVQPTLVVPETKPLDTLLEEMRASGQQVAVVVDEFGGTAGIATLENLVEALVGRIASQSSAGMQAVGAVDSVLEDDGSLVLDGLTRLDELEELISVRVDPNLRDQVDTVGGLIMAALKRLPQVGDEVVVDGRTFKVLALDGRRVAAVQVSPPTDGNDGAVRKATPSG